MTAVVAWGEAALVASAALMLVVLAVRGPVRRWVGPGLGYTLWALPVVRLVLPPLSAGALDGLPLAGRSAAAMQLVVGPRGGPASWSGAAFPAIDAALVGVWLAGAVALFTACAVRHVLFCRRLRATSSAQGRSETIRVIAADVDGPLAFGVFRRCIVVPRGFTRDYDAAERALALAHERAHHQRGDLLANWLSLVVLAVHWWNPVAWVAIRAFREDQEFAADAHVLAASGPGAVASYAHVLARAAGIGALPACNLNPRSTLKGRLMMLGQKPRPRRRLAIGGSALVMLGGTALAATATMADPPGAATGRQAVTIGVKPDGSGGYALIVGDTVVAPGAPLPGGRTLPADFDRPQRAGGCDLKPAAKPFAMVIKGDGATRTYTIMCASAAPAPVPTTLAEGLASLKTMRASVATQPASKVFPETERTHALGAIDRSIDEVEATLAGMG